MHFARESTPYQDDRTGKRSAMTGLQRGKIGLRIFLLLGWILWGRVPEVSAQGISVKTNMLYWATTTPNIGMEIDFGGRTTLDFEVGYNPWTLDRDANRKAKHVLVIPEFRYWLCESFRGHFFGLHTGYSYYNLSGIRIPLHDGTRWNRYQGWATGVGLTYGYVWILGGRWNLEASAGVGYVYTDYRRYECITCGDYYGRRTRHLFTPTKVGLTLIYRIN